MSLYGIWRVNPIDWVVGFANVILGGSYSDFSPWKRFIVWVSRAIPCRPNPSFHSHTADAWLLAWGGYLFLLRRLWKEFTEAWTHVCVYVCVHCRVHTCMCPCAGPRQRQLHVACPAPPWSWPTFFPPAPRSLFNCRAAHWGHLLSWGPSPWRCREAFRICSGLTNREIEVREWG